MDMFLILNPYNATDLKREIRIQVEYEINFVK